MTDLTKHELGPDTYRNLIYDKTCIPKEKSNGFNEWCEIAGQASGKTIVEHPTLIFTPKNDSNSTKFFKEETKIIRRRKYRRIFRVRMGNIFPFII